MLSRSSKSFNFNIPTANFMWLRLNNKRTAFDIYKIWVIAARSSIFSHKSEPIGFRLAFPSKDIVLVIAITSLLYYIEACVNIIGRKLFILTIFVKTT